MVAAARVPSPPSSRLPASATYSHSAKEPSCLSRDPRSPTGERDQLGDSISRWTATSGGESEASSSPLQAPFAGGEPVAFAERQRPGPPSATPALDRGPR